MAGRSRSVARARRWAKRRRALILALAVAAIGVFFAKERTVQHAAARAAPAITKPSPSPSVVRPVASRPTVTASPKASLSQSPSPSPSPTPDGPAFVLDAAPSCAGSTALIDVQVAATAKRPIVKLELLLDGATIPLTPVPGYPMTSYAGRSSGHASLNGSGEWVLRATDKKGIVEAQPFPYACA